MSIVKSFSVGNGDMFYIDHNSDNFTIIDCCLSSDNRKTIVDEIQKKAGAKGVARFISTHPDGDHIQGLVYLDDQISIANFYVVDNEATKSDETEDFTRYRALRDSPQKSFKIFAGCTRRWMNESDAEREASGIQVLWPKTANDDYGTALLYAKYGIAYNDMSAIIEYGVKDGARVLWMGDMTTEFMKKIEHEVMWPKVDILFAPHHGRDSGRVPQSILDKLSPKVVVVGEAQSEHLHYYPTCNTITQNSAGDITFTCDGAWVDVYVSKTGYFPAFLYARAGHPAVTANGWYVGSFVVHAAAAVAA